MANVFQCHYMKAAIFKINSAVHSSEKKLKFELFTSQFNHLKMDMKIFYTYVKRFTDMARKRKFSVAEKDFLIKNFSADNWNKLDNNNKALHTIHECIPCKSILITQAHSDPPCQPLPTPSIPTSISVSSDVSALHSPTSLSFSSPPNPSLVSPSSSSNLTFIKQPCTPNTFFSPTPASKSTSNTSVKTPTTPFSSLRIDVPIPEKSLPGAAKVAAKAVVEQVNPQFLDIFGSSFTEVLVKVPDAKLQHRPTNSEHKKRYRKLQRSIKASIEDQMHTRDTETHFGTRQTRSQYTKQRLSLYFESKEDATDRTAKRKLDEDSGKRKAKRHAPNPDTIDFDRAGLLNEIQNLPDGAELNLSAMARKYGIDGRQGNMVVREFLEQNEVNISQFKNNKINKERVRRSNLKMKGGDISAPMPRTHEHLRKELLEFIESGKILLGELIEPKTYVRLKLVDGKLVTEKYQVHGRKLPLEEIRIQIYQEHKSLGILKPFKEYTRFLANWGDHSSILNSGYLLYTVKVIFSADIFYTDEEMLENFNKKLNVQSLVEQPQIYIVGQCQDSIAEKMSYAAVRREDALELSKPIMVDEVTLNDQMRFFIGDHPELQFESGNSIGGSYPCACGSDGSRFHDIAYTFRHNQIDTLDSRRTKLIAGPAGRNKNSVNPYEKLKVGELHKEIFDRNLSRQIKGKGLKDEIEGILKRHMSGLARAPPMCFGECDNSLDNTALSSYEVSPVEPLHDLKGHIRNVIELLPHYLSENIQKSFSNYLEAALGKKDTYRGSDYRLAIITLYTQMKGSCPIEIEQLLYTLSEISRLAYLPSVRRTPKKILRCFNITFRHAMLCVQIFGTRPAKLPKFYGSYFHALTTHLPEVYRMISPSSLYTESEERIFSSIRGIVRSTSNRSKESIRDVGIVRFQAEKLFREKNDSPRNSVESKITQYEKMITEHENTRFHLGENSEAWQEHLKRIPDYLLCRNDPWWTLQGNEVVFFDGDAEADFRTEGPEMFNFKSTNLTEIQKYVNATWIRCSKITDLIEKLNADPTYDEGSDEEPEITPEKEQENVPFEEDQIKEIDNELIEDIPEDHTDENASPTGLRNTDMSLSHKLKSKIGKSLYYVLGMCEEVRSFDEHHILFRDYRYESSKQICCKLKNSLIPRIKTTYEESKSYIKNWEKEYFKANLALPLSTDMDQETSRTYSKMNHAKSIIKLWKLQ